MLSVSLKLQLNFWSVFLTIGRPIGRCSEGILATMVWKDNGGAQLVVR